MLHQPVDSFELLKKLVAIPGPPGQETRVREALKSALSDMGLEGEMDAKGNLVVCLGPPSEEPDIVVTAHMDEIGLMVENVRPDGMLTVIPLGGLLPWKWGEGPVSILAKEGDVPGILSFGSIHTESEASPITKAKGKGLLWSHATVFTGLTAALLKERGIRPGTRIAMAPSQRTVVEMGAFVGSYFLDDRADLVAWLRTIEKLQAKEPTKSILFAATTSEEVGGEGALFLLQRVRPAICVALELGPMVPESQFELDATPTVWVRDSYACIDPRDIEVLEQCEEELKMDLHWQALSRGGSDASCAASHGHCARPVTLGIPMENTHGFEIMHRDAPDRLADLTLAYIQHVSL